MKQNFLLDESKYEYDGGGLRYVNYISVDINAVEEFLALPENTPVVEILPDIESGFSRYCLEKRDIFNIAIKVDGKLVRGYLERDTEIYGSKFYAVVHPRYWGSSWSEKLAQLGLTRVQR